MLFNSLSFLIFFPLTTAIFFALPCRLRWFFLLICSAAFYAAFIPKYLLVLLLVILIDYIAGLAIAATQNPLRRAFLILSLLANIGLLATFKYFDFLNDNVHAFSEMLHWTYPVRNLGWLLPIGLSFHTFQSMAYTIEVYRGNQRAERNLGIYALYVLFYPQLVAGPIERPQNLIHQFRERHDFNADRIFAGLRQMLWGFFKKLVIADRMATIVDAIYSHPHAWGGGFLLLATYAFAIQIYCDFAGYSDIAIGAARVLGFNLMTNFDRPYAARSIAEFWRRWHISLSTWFKDYLYIPLGGSRVPLPRWCFNILIVFVISGLWHGASWTFAIWGALHGLFLITSRLSQNSRQRLATRLGLDQFPTLSTAWKIFVTFNLVALTWIFFRASSLHDALWITTHLFQGPWLAHPSFGTGLRELPPFTRHDLLLSLVLVIVLESVQWAQFNNQWLKFFHTQPVWIRWPAYYATVVAILWVGELGARSFIYFQF
jgi:alginate O-acetyltransferase complex protein AlgI